MRHRLMGVATGVEFRLLGDIEAFVDDRPVAIGYAQLRCVLAILLIDANHTVSVDQIVDRVWGTRRLPRHPRSAVQHSVAMLRRVLADAGNATLTRRSNGYQLVVDAQAVDMHLFQSLVSQARAAQDDEHTAGLFEQALRLWRGEPFTGLDTPWLNSVRGTLTAQRQAARRDLHDVQLRLGYSSTLLADLSDEAERHPLDERVARQYMLALYHSGRQADALEHYERIRRRLADQLGADPSSPLRQVHLQILTADPALASQGRRITAATPSAPVPRQLPRSPRFFVGRARELDFLDATLDERAAAGPAVVISALVGAGGIGKTWLALHWAHQHLDRFPDGQLYVNLRGFDPSGQPMDPETAIRGFLVGLGVDAASVPQGLDAQAGLYRTLVAGKHLLVMLDNVRDTTQIVALLPGSPGCTVLATSRERLPGLVGAHGAHPFTVDVLLDAEARELLTARLGAERVAAEPGPVTDLVACCGGVPLALSIVAGRAQTHPEFPLTVLATELRDTANRLRALDNRDPVVSLPAVLSWSFQALDTDTATMFALMGLAPGPDISASSVVAMTGLPTARVVAALRELENASLVQQHAPGRYRIHDLTRLHAVQHANQNLPAATVDAALRRLLDVYLHTALTADRLLEPYRDPIHIGPLAAAPQRLTDEAAALAWFAAEHANLLAGQHLAAGRDWYTVAWQLAWALHTFHYRRGHLHEDLEVCRVAAAAAAADELDDPVARILAQRLLGYAAGRAEQPDLAAKHLEAALTLAEDTGDVPAQAHTQHALAWVSELKGDDEQALAHASEGLRLFRSLDDVSGEALALNAVGWYEARLGHYEQAHAHCAAAHALFRDHNDRDSEAATLDSLGYIADQAGHHNQARTYYRQALAAFRDLGNTYEEATTLEHLGEAHHALGHLGQARETWRQALHLYETQHRTADADRVRHQLDMPATNPGAHE
jgi:DNA-binding SARP family transcriptional activator/tetratricopeptide (TPR) repeat protein